MIPEWLKPLFRFGTGVGIVIGARDLRVCVAQIRPKSCRILCTATIPDFRERPASEWGEEYRKVLESLKAGPLPAIAVLPREQVLMRVVSLPGVKDEDAESAIGFQIDSLHPYEGEQVVHDWQRVGSTSSFAVVIAEKRVIDEYVALFAEAGVVLAGMTLTACTVFSSMRIYGEPPASGVLAVGESEAGSTEMYGESDARPLFSAVLPASAERAAAMAASEMRLAAEVEPRTLADLLPAWSSAPEDFDFSDEGRQRAAGPWAAALTAAQPRFARPLNLLPAELRFVSSRLLWVPTAVLAGVLLLTLGAWFVMGKWQEKKYLAELGLRIERAVPLAQKVEAIDKEVANVVERIQLLDEYRKRTRTDLDLLLEVTEHFPPPAFLSSLAMDSATVAVGGEVPNTDGLLKKLDSSPRLSGSEFTTPLARSTNYEIFRLRSRREGGVR